MQLNKTRRHQLAPAERFDSRPWHEYTQGFAVHRELIRDAGLSQGLEFERLSRRTYLLRNSKLEIRFLRRMSERTSVVAREITNDKELTRLHLQRAQVRCPKGRLFAGREGADAWKFALELGKSVVVKPVRGSGGRGVSLDVHSEAAFQQAWTHTGRGGVIVEQYVPGDEYRFFVLEDRVVAVARRIPAQVFGDGRSTVTELIEKKNAERQPNPYVGSKAIEISPDVVARLEAMNLSPGSVPGADRRVQLKCVSNVGAGGDSEDWTSRVHPGFVAAAVAAKEAIPGLYHAGIDLIAPDITSSPVQQGWSVCEVNSNPDIALHHFPVFGLPRDVAGVLVRALFRRRRGRARQH